MKNNFISIIDISSSGFTPVSDKVMEVCCILVNPTTLEIVECDSWIVQHPARALESVPDFHRPLADLCEASELSITRVQGEILAGGWLQAGVFCNRALESFDMRFLAVHLPLVHKEMTRPGKLLLDLRALESLALARGVPAWGNPEPVRTYRAVDDAIAAYGELAHYLAAMGGTMEGGA